MGLKQAFTRFFLMRVGLPRIKRMVAGQKSIRNLPCAILPLADSPIRFEIPLEAVKMMQSREDFDMKQTFPVRRMFSIMRNINASVDSLSDNPSKPLLSLTSEALDKLRQHAYSLGVSTIGFVKLPQSLIFQEFGVILDNAIVLTMEMDGEKIDKAPSQDTMNMVFGTYDELGIAANKIASYLRERGYAAQADHPLGGLVLFPPLAQEAGLGWIGKHGMLITPEFGPRVRLAAVYTSIQNLPYAASDEYSWISEYCDVCGLCLKQCPPDAILEKPVVKKSGQVTHIRQRECFEFFAQNYGCSVCVKACPFSEGPEAYNRLHQLVERRRSS
jgi:epoxyqueuosine reductase